MDNKKIITRKYAKAFLNLYLEKISVDLFNNIKKLEKFFDAHKTAVYFLSIPSIKRKTKEKILNELFEKFGLKNLFEPLIRVLATDKRLFLIDEIAKNIRLLYKERKNIMMFNITSSHQLGSQDLEIIEQFLASKTGKKIMSQYNIDKSLVAGIRLQSSTLLWEYSIKKQCVTLCEQFNYRQCNL
ncbi:ATP synthase F1 subunit delta [Candidatus Dependentiae bacterium]